MWEISWGGGWDQGKKNQRLLWDSGQGSGWNTVRCWNTYREKEVIGGTGWGRQDWRQRMSCVFNMWSLYHQVEMLGSKYEAQVAQILKIYLQCRRPGFNPGVGKIPWREWQPTPGFLPGKAHEHGILEGYSPWDRKKLNMTELGTHMKLRRFLRWFSGKEYACQPGNVGSIPESGRSPGEGNGNPLQYSCLGNPMESGVWWTRVHGITKSQIWLSD